MNGLSLIDIIAKHQPLEPSGDDEGYYAYDVAEYIQSTPDMRKLDPSERARMELNEIRRIVGQRWYNHVDEDGYPLWINIEGDGARIHLHREDASYDQVMEYVHYLESKRDSYEPNIRFFTDYAVSRRKNLRKAA